MRRLFGTVAVFGVLVLLSYLMLGCGGGTLNNNVSSTGPGPSPTPTPSSPEGHSVSISWQASASSGVTSYNVYRSPVTGGPYARVGNATGTSFTDTTVQAGKTYFYVVTSLNASQVESAVSTETTVTVPTP